MELPVIKSIAEWRWDRESTKRAMRICATDSQGEEARQDILLLNKLRTEMYCRPGPKGRGGKGVTCNLLLLQMVLAVWNTTDENQS